GANGIQALDLLGRKLAMKGGMYFMTYSNEIELFCEANVAHPKLGKLVQAVKDAKDKLMTCAMSFNPMMGGNPMTGVYHALPFLYMFGDVTLAWLHAQMALVAQAKLDGIVAAAGAAEKDAYKALLEANPEAKFYDNKVTVAEFFISQLLPRINWFEAAMVSGDLSGLKKEP
ncbi:MAG: acyl-CoA dehydrogenase C-terminal domain-containing protein, partial [Myxococcota bacterium]